MGTSKVDNIKILKKNTKAFFMKITFAFVLVLVATAYGDLTLKEIDSDKFGHTLLDTIMLELKNLPDGALTGPPKVIYDMLIELRNSLMGEQTDDNEGLDRMCLECTSTINEYKSKVEGLKVQMAADAEEAQTLRDNMAALSATVASTSAEVERLSFLLQFMDNAHRDQMEGIDALLSEAQ